MTTISQLRIDTSVVRITGAQSAKSPLGEGLTPHSALSSTNKRMRNVSPASTSSTLSLTSPAPSSSGNASTSSLLLPQTSTSDSATTASSASSSKLSPPPIEKIQSEYVLAMHDFLGEQKNATCLTFRAGQVIHVLNRDSSGWWDGELDGNRGWFPSNYVNGDLGLLADDDLPPSVSRRRLGHSHSRSTVSTASYSSSSSRQGPFSRDDYCPPLMVPLLHALSLLQNAVRSNRIAHFQPSVACIISCVRSILAAAECLSRDAPLLRRYAALGQERKRVLSDLAGIVTQAKKASLEEPMDEDERDAEVEQMVRLGGQVFSRVRRFLAVAVQCGVQLPDKRLSADYPSMLSESLASQTPERISKPAVTTPKSGGEEDDTLRVTPWRTTNAVGQRPRMRARDRPGTPGTAMKARSMGDLRSPRKAPVVDAEKKPVPALTPRKVQQLKAFKPANGRLNSAHKHEMSVSSMSSSSSFSSVESSGPPTTPPFPSGPSTYEELMDTLRHTHDQYLSTIAAFIGHAHSHSRSSHASSTGHMYELVREIVEIVCKLLIVVEAVLRHPTVPPHKVANLRAAKEGLYQVTSSLAESVRLLTGVLPSNMSEEQEKAALIRSATDALKAGADCVAAVKMCLNRSTGEKPIVIELPGSSEEQQKSLSPRNFLQGMPPRLMKSASMDALHKQQASDDISEDEDDTVQLQSSSPGAMFQRHEQPIIEVSEEAEMSEPVTPVERFRSASPVVQEAERTHPPLPCLHISHAQVLPDLQSPTSITRTDDDGTTWEGSHRQHDQGRGLEEKILNGDLPSVPMASIPEFMQPQDSESWTQSHDYSLEDVAYNTEGVLVGASMQALVEKMTPHASIVEPAFSAVFFLTFRLFSSPMELVQVIIDRYNILPPPDLTEERMYLWQQRKGIPVRLRVSNFIKVWLEMHWRPVSDNVVLPLLLDFNRDALAVMFPGPSQRIHDLIMMRTHQVEDVLMTPRLDRIRDAGMPINPPMINSPSEIPRPVMTKTLFSHLRANNFGAIYITDFDCLELARQLTVMECNLFCAIQSEEVLESGLEGAKFPVNVRAVSTLSTVITGWVAESILNETDIKKRTTLVKFFIKLADRCTTLHNFSTSRSILAALDSSTISRLHQTWMAVPQKHKLQLDAIRKLADHARNYHEYRSRLRNTAPPAVPFLGLYLTDITFCREGNPSHRTSPLAADKKLLNFNKYHKMARIVQDMQRFQVPYTLKEIPEVQAYLHDAFERSKHHGDLQDLYRRSLLVEPKQAADTPPAGDVRQLFPWASRSQTNQPMPI
ncbi:ras GEF [Artomyces pyxidatus]|uniref:Ras GEF n=1 Tax=Artomyces pyxidatus TaxID=48021 RepID=A0ACB8SI94_9AGAM|nr:ras GEF [Artomyces pyxidatus]